jgi:RNA polymerase sigma factor (sigma-70 family)
LLILLFVNTERFQHITDQELLDHFYNDRNNEWLGILLQRYTLLLFGVCMKYLKNEEEAKDTVQQIFLKAITELHKYKVEYFKSWIYMVARNHCLMKLRNMQGKTPVSINEQTIISPEDDLQKKIHFEKDHILGIMESSLTELNNEQKLCVTLFYLEKKSYQEITDKTGYTLMQVKSYIQNGKRNLKLLMDRKLKTERKQADK